MVSFAYSLSRLAILVVGPHGVFVGKDICFFPAQFLLVIGFVSSCSEVNLVDVVGSMKKSSQ